jgi:hypothetical protein
VLGTDNVEKKESESRKKAAHEYNNCKKSNVTCSRRGNTSFLSVVERFVRILVFFLVVGVRYQILLLLSGFMVQRPKR